MTVEKWEVYLINHGVKPAIAKRIAAYTIKWKVSREDEIIKKFTRICI